MAVFTEVSDKDARELLRRMSLGSFKELRGIQGGIENTNYFLTTEQGEWVLTLFERLTAEQLPFYLYLMKHLAQAGIPVPDPQAETRSGDILLRVCGKPASIVNRLPGRSRLTPSPRTAPPWARCWRACTWPAETTIASSPICAACPGGTRPCPR